jgi:hypothetical protein
VFRVEELTYYAEAREEYQGDANDVDGDVDLVMVVRAILQLSVSATSSRFMAKAPPPGGRRRDLAGLTKTSCVSRSSDMMTRL